VFGAELFSAVGASERKEDFLTALAAFHAYENVMIRVYAFLCIRCCGVPLL
jgi:hypothetical protein